MSCTRLALLLALCLSAPGVLANAGYARFPALHEDTLVFTAEGDLWTVSIHGGSAQRLTTHPGLERDAAISPDGTQVAFVGQMDGADEVYVMPLAGGQPRRLTFEGGRTWVRGWTPDAQVLYTSEQVVGPSWSRVLRIVDPDTLRGRELPLTDANHATLDASGKRIWFSRFGLELTADHARGYRGGASAQLWRFGPDALEPAQRLLQEHKASFHTPMWWQGSIYLISDLSGSDNLWRMDEDGSNLRQLTQHSDFEVRQASLSAGRIAYQHGADIRIYDIDSAEDSVVPLALTTDYEQRRQRWLQTPLDFLSSMHLGGDGQRVALTARARVIVAGTGALRRVDIAADPAHRLREAVLSPDGRWVYAIYDASGEPEIWRFPADGSEGGEALTSGGKAHRWRLLPSPDGRWLAHSDSRGVLSVLNLLSGEVREIDRGSSDDPHADLSWSADSKALAFARSDSVRRINQIMLHVLAERRTEVLTSDRFESHSPAFSPDGKWLYFLSDRHFRATPGHPWGDRNMGPMFDRRTQVFAYALQPDLRFPFAADDELSLAVTKPDKDEDKDKDQQSQSPILPAIVWAGLPERLYEVPLAAGNYSRLSVDKSRLYFLETDIAPGAKPLLRTLAIGNEAAKPETFAEDVRGYALAAGADKLAYITGANALYIVDRGAKAPSELAAHQVRLDDWRLALDPLAEWQQMFVDAWRNYREFLFDRNLRAVDWDAVRDRYAALLPRVSDRLELDDLLGQMVAELSVLHSQVRGGDYRADPAAPALAFLGARLDAEDGGLRILSIHRSEPDLPSARSPLARAGVDAREGDLIIAVNGRQVRTFANLARALENQSGKQVLLALQRGTRSHQTVVHPVSAADEATLRYSDWVEGNRAQVDAASDGRIGYLHLRAMGGGDIASFVRDFHGQFEREGLIIDVRRNRGGNIDSWIIGTLLRRAWAYWQTGDDSPHWNPQQSFRGHLAVLIDPLTYSDGETFAAGIKALELGTVIGQRTAGAGVWLTGRHQLADRGIARVAEFPQFGSDGRWLLEGHGVAPDIEVDNSPDASWRGEDAQLQTALAHLQQRLEESPVVTPESQPIAPRGTPGQDIR